MPGLFITFEGTEGGGKSTQIQRLSERLESLGRRVRRMREPGGTLIGEEIRHTLQHSAQNQAMVPEAELLLINASRAQLVREVIRPSLAVGEFVLCDRFYDSTVAYQGYGRGLDLKLIGKVIDFVVGPTRPHLTFLLHVPVGVSESRRQSRQAAGGVVRDRMEEAGRDFFERVEQGYRAIATAEPGRVKWIDATGGIPEVGEAIWEHVKRLLGGGGLVE